MATLDNEAPASSHRWSAALRRRLGLVWRRVARAVSLRALTRSKPSLAASGTPSVSETAALAAAGQDATLLGPRVSVGPVTCAIAVAGDLP